MAKKSGKRRKRDMGRRRPREKWKGKKWYAIQAPEMFGETEIGETPAADPEQVVGRVIETTLGDLTNDFSKQHVKLYLQIERLEGNNVKTRFIGHDLTRDYVRSLVRRGSSRVETVANVTTKDGYKMRVKGIALTTDRAKTSKEKAVRQEVFKTIQKIAAKRTFKQFVQEIVLGKVAADIYKQAHTRYPLRKIEIRKTEVIEEPT